LFANQLTVIDALVVRNEMSILNCKVLLG